MGIKSFNIIIQENLKRKPLNDSTIVFDAKNFFYDVYEYFKLPFTFGCDSDVFAEHVKEYLMMFKKANIQCYFVFKGGTFDIIKSFQKKSRNLSANYIPGINNYIHPLYADYIITEVLNDMGYKYVFCEFEAKNTCILLAHMMSCPIVSYDNEFGVANIDYIPHNIKNFLNIKDKAGQIECGIFNLKDFLRESGIALDIFILFVVLTDESIFPQNYFSTFYQIIGCPSANNKRNKYLLNWLNVNGKRIAKKYLLKLKNVNKEQLSEAIARAEALVNRKEDGGLPLQYIKGEVEIVKFDPQWFEKGIILQYIDKSYVDLYRSKTINASNIIQDYKQTNAILLSLEIIKYAYDLLTNFKGGEITIRFLMDHEPPVKIALSTQSPNYDCHSCVFENGWENIKHLNLFQHFITEKLESFDFTILENAPEDAKLLLIALVYFSKQKSIDTSNEILSILMSHVMLNVVSTELYETTDTERPTPDTTLDKNPVLRSDCIKAMDCLKSNFTSQDIVQLFDFEIVHPLSEFQHCLDELNKLNNLCGKPYKPILYSKMYNGTFIYNFLLYLKDNNGIHGINNILHQSVTVLAYFNRLWHIFTDIEHIN